MAFVDIVRRAETGSSNGPVVPVDIQLAIHEQLEKNMSKKPSEKLKKSRNTDRY